MLESSADRLVDDPHAAHFGCVTKRPMTRVRVIENAGALRIPFHGGVLVGIGETSARASASTALEATAHAKFDHVQEVLVQNFRAKPDTRMRDAPEPDLNELLWTVAVARLAFGPDMPVQCPPNLTPTPADSGKERRPAPPGPKFHSSRPPRLVVARAPERGRLVLRRNLAGARHARSRLAGARVALTG